MVFCFDIWLFICFLLVLDQPGLKEEGYINPFDNVLSCLFFLALVFTLHFFSERFSLLLFFQDEISKAKAKESHKQKNRRFCACLSTSGVPKFGLTANTFKARESCCGHD